MKTLRFNVLIEKDEDGFLVATVPSLKSCYTQARTMEELLPRVREAIEASLGPEEPVELKLVGVQQIEVVR
jgi:predicted RNase H-like HicB family nuclease